MQRAATAQHQNDYAGQVPCIAKQPKYSLSSLVECFQKFLLSSDWGLVWIRLLQCKPINIEEGAQCNYFLERTLFLKTIDEGGSQFYSVTVSLTSCNSRTSCTWCSPDLPRRLGHAPHGPSSDQALTSVSSRTSGSGCSSDLRQKLGHVPHGSSSDQTLTHMRFSKRPSGSWQFYTNNYPPRIENCWKRIMFLMLFDGSC